MEFRITESTTDQEVLDHVAAHLRAQGGRSRGIREEMRQPICLYRSDGGRSCAVGCLIPDELYDPWLEGCTVETLCGDARPAPRAVVRYLGATSPSRRSLLKALQGVHDGAANWGDGFSGEGAFNAAGERALRAAALGHRLAYPAP